MRRGYIVYDIKSCPSAWLEPGEMRGHTARSLRAADERHGRNGVSGDEPFAQRREPA